MSRALLARNLLRASRQTLLAGEGCSVRGQTVKKVRSEEGINAELRQLTQQTRRLRQELQEMIRPGSRDHVRAFAHPRWRKPPPEMSNERRKRNRNG